MLDFEDRRENENSLEQYLSGKISFLTALRVEAMEHFRETVELDRHSQAAWTQVGNLVSDVLSVMISNPASHEIETPAKIVDGLLLLLRSYDGVAYNVHPRIRLTSATIIAQMWTLVSILADAAAYTVSDEDAERTQVAMDALLEIQSSRGEGATYH